MWEVKQARKQRRSPLLENVRRILTEPEEWDDVEVEVQGDVEVQRQRVKGFPLRLSQMCDQGGFEIESLVGRFLRDNNEIASILSTADRQTTWMLSQPMREDLGRDGVRFTDLKRRPMTVYVILPAERMRTHSVWLRLVIVTALRALYSTGGLSTLFMLDEFAQLGHLGPIEDAFGLVRGYGIQLWPVLQDLNQLKALYKERWETFIGNAGVVQGFAPNDLTTSEWMSRMGGETTIVATGFSQSDSQNPGGVGTSAGLSYQQIRRPLFLPQELRDFRDGSGLVFPAGTSKSIPFFARSYWEEPSMAARAQRNPYVRV
jgi:type IV secretion system protein VirD4